MPTVLVIDQRKGSRRLLELVFPREKPEHLWKNGGAAVERWEWPEVRVGTSSIQGFGLFPQSSPDLDWSELRRPIAMPYLGMETEVESGAQARVLRTVLCGGFDIVKRGELTTPSGHDWVEDGLYVTLMSKKDRRALSDPPPIVSNPEEVLLQVAVEPEFNARAVSYINVDDEQVCYLKKEVTRSLLHLPNHIFDLLAGHANDHHADRNMATHLVQFQREPHTHLLVSAHPAFRNSAYIMGNGATRTGTGTGRVPQHTRPTRCANQPIARPSTKAHHAHHAHPSRRRAAAPPRRGRA